MSRIAAPILLSDQERTTLQTWARARSQAQRVVQRAQIILLAADGVESQVIAPAASRLAAHRATVARTFFGLAHGRIAERRASSGSLPAIPDHKVAAIVEATLHRQPPNATHWSTRLMAKTQGVSEATVRRIWKRAWFEATPHLDV